jgi:hypothetical protein
MERPSADRADFPGQQVLFHFFSRFKTLCSTQC